jgi:group I intron endonuclease
MLIYLIYCTKTQKGYIGQTTIGVRARWKQHRRSAERGSPYAIHKAIRKYGEGAFEISVLYRCYALHELGILEKYFITKHHTLAPNGYNLNSGGKHPKLAKEVRIRISKANRGQKRTSEQRARMRAGAKGRKVSIAGRASLSRAHLGIKHTEEQKAKISRAHKLRLQRDPTALEKLRCVARRNIKKAHATTAANKRKWSNKIRKSINRFWKSSEGKKLRRRYSKEYKRNI